MTVTKTYTVRKYDKNRKTLHPGRSGLDRRGAAGKAESGRGRYCDFYQVVT